MPETEPTPVIQFYGRNGETDYEGEFYLTPGLHDFAYNSMPNDVAYSFQVQRPQPGYTITIYNNGKGSEDESWASYKLTGPFPTDPNPFLMDSTPLLKVDAAYGVPIGAEIAPGVRANGHRDSSQLAGKVSSVRVTKDATS
ncbi:hypothetical protein [Streptomyces sp. NPDC050485]|uniref:hypothetical protein n=1 Tax=Streptomyces sp. NPDC050485 TaxID=3365617 RepID=UPI0037884D7A